MDIVFIFSRGKTSGHDVDILITHPTEDKINGALLRLLHSLESTDTVLCGRLEHSTYTDDVLSRNTKLTTRGQLDHFEKWIGVLKVPKKVRKSTVEPGTNVDLFDSRLSAFCDTTKNSNKSSESSKQNTTSDEENTGCHSRTQIIYSRNESSRDTETNEVEPVSEVREEEIESLNGSVDASELKSGHVKGRDARSSDKTPAELAVEERDWLARRVDLIIAPYRYK